MHRFTPNYGIVATVTFTDNPEVFHIEFLQGIQWLPPVLLQSITMPKCPTAEDSFKEDLNRQIESWHDDWITAGEPWLIRPNANAVCLGRRYGESAARTIYGLYIA